LAAEYGLLASERRTKPSTLARAERMKGMLMIRHLSSGPSAMLKTTVMTVLLLGATAVAGAQPPDVHVEHASQPATVPSPDAGQVGFHDLICKPNGTEDGFDCADEATPAKIVPIPSQVQRPRPQDEPVSG
jgi:hypothetical protein